MIVTSFGLSHTAFMIYWWIIWTKTGTLGILWSTAYRIPRPTEWGNKTQKSGLIIWNDDLPSLLSNPWCAPLLEMCILHRYLRFYAVAFSTCTTWFSRAVYLMALTKISVGTLDLSHIRRTESSQSQFRPLRFCLGVFRGFSPASYSSPRSASSSVDDST